MGSGHEDTVCSGGRVGAGAMSVGVGAPKKGGRAGVGTCGGLVCGSPVIEGEVGVEVTGSGSEKWTTTFVTITCVKNRPRRKTQMVDGGMTISHQKGKGRGGELPRSLLCSGE